MTKSSRDAKRTSALLLSGLLFLSTLSPALSQSTATQAGAGKPESDNRSAAETIESVDNKVEKKLESDGYVTPQGGKTQSAESAIQSVIDGMKDQPKDKPQTGSATPAEGGGKVESASVLMKDPVSTGSEPPKGEKPATPGNNGVSYTITKPDANAAKTGVPMPKAAEPKGESMKLFGRIEQIASDSDLKLPVLKAQTAKLDPRGKLLPGEVEKYSGTIAKAFPKDFRGTWGGNLAVWSYKYSPAYLTVDRDEAVQTATILKNGRSGNANFQFYTDASTGGVALEPTKVLLSVPIKDTHSFSQMMAGGTDGSLGPFAGAFNQIMGNMEAPVVMLYFGKAQTDNMQTGVSGNQFRQDVYKNVIRDLGPGVIEQQIVTKYVSRTQSGKTNSGYDESVMRFKKLSESKLYVLCASVKYTSSGKYLSKLIMYGTVDRGHVVQTNPYAGMSQMMGGMNMGGMNMGNMQQQMQQMQQMFGGGGGGQGGQPIVVPNGGFGGMGGFGNMKLPSGAGQGGNMNDILKQLQNFQK